MSLASWCVTLVVTLVQIMNLNVVKRVFISSFNKEIFGCIQYWTFGSSLVCCVMYTCILLFIQAVKALFWIRCLSPWSIREIKLFPFDESHCLFLILSGFTLNLEYKLFIQFFVIYKFCLLYSFWTINFYLRFEWKIYRIIKFGLMILSEFGYLLSSII